MFDGDSEPSSALPFHFTNDVEMMQQAIILKRALIEFGEHFSQQIVHLLAFKTTEPHAPIGELEDEDWTSQELHSVRFREMLPNYLLRLEQARECNIQNLTITEINNEAMIYSTGKADPTFANKVQCFREMAGSAGQIDTLTARVLLWNVGNVEIKEFGATHTYAEWRAAYGANE